MSKRHLLLKLEDLNSIPVSYSNRKELTPENGLLTISNKHTSNTYTLIIIIITLLKVK